MNKWTGCKRIKSHIQDQELREALQDKSVISLEEQT